MPLLPTSEILAEDNIRHKLDDDSVKDLAASILSVHALSGGEKTLLQPVTVEKLAKKTAEGHTHRLRYGFRRLAAMQYLERTYPEKCFWAMNIPVIIDDAVYNEEDGSLSSFRLVENVQREDMTLLEEAMAIKRVMKERDLKQADVAQALGKSKGWVSQRLALLRMDESIQLGVQEGKFGQAHVREFARIKKKQDQSEVASKLLQEKKGASVDQVRRAVNKVVGPPAPKKSPKQDASAPEAPATPDDSGTETSRTPAAEPNPANAPKTPEAPGAPKAPEPPAPSREEVLKSMTHEDKVAFLKEEAAARESAEPKPAISVDALKIEAKRCAKRAAEALEHGNDLEAKYFSGAEQAFKFALGTVKSIRYTQKKAAG